MKILLVDDHKMLRDGLRAILEREGLTVVGEAATGYEALELAQSLTPDIIVMDISMPDLNGVDATRHLVGARADVKVIALSMHSDRRYVIAMFEAGARGYLLKNSASEELIQAVQAVARGLTYVSPSIGHVVVDSIPFGTKSARALSAREREVLQLLAEGKSSKDIASTLHLALPTVETHRRQIMDKLSIRSIAELTKYAIREGLTSVE